MTSMLSWLEFCSLEKSYANKCLPSCSSVRCLGLPSDEMVSCSQPLCFLATVYCCFCVIFPYVGYV